MKLQELQINKKRIKMNELEIVNRLSETLYKEGRIKPDKTLTSFILPDYYTAKIIDTWLDYELLKLHIPNMVTTPIVLKMKNPSIGYYHIEGVPSYIKTVQEALTWRCNGFTWNPKQLT